MPLKFFRACAKSVEDSIAFCIGRPFLTLAITAKYLAIAHLFTEYGYSFGGAHGPSMLPTFEIYTYGLLSSKRHRMGRGVQVGDVVSYKIPINDDTGMKRVIGMPGDYVLVHTPEKGSDEMIQVPPGHCWLVGDNLPASRDSRHFGPLPLALVKGKILTEYSPERGGFRILKNPLSPPKTSP